MVGCIGVLGSNTQGHIMAVGDAHVFPDFLTPVMTQLPFPKPLTTFLTCFSRGEGQKNTGKKVCLNPVSNSQPPGHESDMLTTEPPGQGIYSCMFQVSLVLSKDYKASYKMTVIKNPQCPVRPSVSTMAPTTSPTLFYGVMQDPFIHTSTSCKAIPKISSKQILITSKEFFLATTRLFLYQMM